MWEEKLHVSTILRFCCIASLLASPRPVNATILTFQFSGEITQVPLDEVFGDIGFGDAFQGSFDNGVDLKVRYVDNQRALHAISQSSPPDSEVVTDYVPRCPKCHSSEIVFQNLDSTPGSNSAFDSTFNWSCDACGHRWKDDGIEHES